MPSAGTAPQSEAIARHDHRGPRAGELDPLSSGGQERNAIAIGDVAEQITGHVTAIDLVPIVIDRHEEIGGKRVRFLLTLLLSRVPWVDLQGQASEIRVRSEFAVSVVASGHFETKREAIDRGREISRNAGSEFKIHNRDGWIGQSDSHGNDPRDIKG